MNLTKLIVIGSAATLQAGAVEMLIPGMNRKTEHDFGSGKSGAEAFIRFVHAQCNDVFVKVNKQTSNLQLAMKAVPKTAFIDQNIAVLPYQILVGE